MSKHSKHFRRCNPIADTRPSSADSALPLYDPKRPGNATGGRPKGWTRQPTEPGRPGSPGAR